jgi:hypothetical protein
MVISSLLWRAVSAFIAVGAAVATVLALAVPAGASTGTRYASVEQVGYAASGAQFSQVRAWVYLRNPAQYASVASQYSQSVQLWSSGLVAVFGASASTSGSGYTPYADIFDARSHELLASDPNPEWCDDAGNCGTTVGTFPAGDRVRFTLTYYPKTGDLYFETDDTTRHFTADYTAGADVSFTQARVGTEFGSDPWTAPASFTRPAAWTKIAVYNRVRLQTYNGKFSTLASWFVHHKVLMVGISGSLSDVEAAPTDLSRGGASFQEWLAPAGVSGPAQPPRG